ncbi:hypothetical protein M8J77_001608 [Diaphorina citri]|nr:hypothetical protein M8J77_001608 [Diaphorina citri]
MYLYCVYLNLCPVTTKVQRKLRLKRQRKNRLELQRCLRFKSAGSPFEKWSRCSPVKQKDADSIPAEPLRITRTHGPV